MASRPPPSEEEISQVIDFAGLDPQHDRPMVIQALKENGCNVEAVVMQYFDNSESFRQKFTHLWNESMFSADRDGTANNAGISFHIESPNNNEVIQGLTPPPEPYGPTAPSRPPSRTNNTSPMGRMLDWVSNDAPASAGPSQEDEDMHRALRESAQEAGIGLIDQQSGIMDGSTSAPTFGPANRTEYDQGSWAMVQSGPSAATTVAQVPAPSRRRRTPGTPAFLVQGTSTVGNHGLGGLLTVLHEIPLARNTLLEVGSPAASYGFNSEWWKGQEILPPEVLTRLQAGDQVHWGMQDEYKPDVEEEIHRLMALLDSTERSYGTVSVLTDLLPSPSLGPEKQLYEYLGPRNEQVLRPLIHSAVLAKAIGDDMGEEEARFGLLEMEHVGEEHTYITTLYESLDHTMWSDALCHGELHAGSKMAMFKDMGDVFVIKLNGDRPAQAIDIPEKLYLEKYQTSRKDEARRIQVAWCETKKAMARIAKEEMSLYEWRNDWKDLEFGRKQMIQGAMDQWRAYRQYLQSLGRFRQMEASGFDTDMYPDYRMAPLDPGTGVGVEYGVVEDVLELTSRMLADIDDKMQNLNAQLEQLKAKQRFLGRLLTEPDKPGRPQPMTCKEFLLRGVVTQSDVVYVCQRSEPDLMQLEEEVRPLDQWWRLAYRPNEEQPVKTEKINVEQVLQDVWKETNVPLLVYATETALGVPRTALPMPLQLFAQAENKAFQEELSRETSQTAGDGKALTTPTVDPISPSKRKHRADSIDSMDSNRASLGSDDAQDGFETPFVDEQASIAAMTASGTPAAEASPVVMASRDEETTEAHMSPLQRINRNL